MATYYELIVKGETTLLRGFLWGFKVAKGVGDEVILCSEAPIRSHHLKELLTLRGDSVHLLTSARHHRSLVSAIGKAKALEFELVSDRLVKRAYFEFRFETFARDVASKLKRLFNKPPEGIRFVDYEPREDVDPSAKGVEMYSPVHDYRYAGKGKAEGNIERLITFHRKLSGYDVIKAEEIELEHGD